MKRIIAFVGLSGLLLFTACKDDGGWTPPRRKWVRHICINARAQMSDEHCACIEREVVTAVTYKEFVLGPYERQITTADKVCQF